MDPIILYVLISLGFILLLLQWLKLAELSRKSTDLRPILDTLHILQSDRGLLDRGIRDENSRNRQEQANESQALRSEVVTTLIAVGDSFAAKVGVVSQSNDQKAELLRTALEQRMDSFASESARKIDGLTQSLSASSALLRDEVSARLGDFKNSLEMNVRESASAAIVADGKCFWSHSDFGIQRWTETAPAAECNRREACAARPVCLIDPNRDISIAEG